MASDDEESPFPLAARVAGAMALFYGCAMTTPVVAVGVLLLTRREQLAAVAIVCTLAPVPVGFAVCGYRLLAGLTRDPHGVGIYAFILAVIFSALTLMAWPVLEVVALSMLAGIDVGFIVITLLAVGSGPACYAWCERTRDS